MLNKAVERFFVEALRTDSCGFLAERRIRLGYVQAACEFRKPSRMGVVLEIAILVERIGRETALDLRAD